MILRLTNNRNCITLHHFTTKSDEGMMNFRKLFLWIFICILTLCALRYGVLESANQYIYNLRNTHIPSFAYRYDDFLPYLPLTVMFGLKIAGIKNRSNWTQMLVATVFSFALMVITVSSIKSLAGVLRPDGSDLLSFPSGHTATAFTSACLLLSWRVIPVTTAGK